MTDTDPKPASPNARMRDLATGYFVSRALQVAARLDIATALTHGPRTCSDLAQVTQTHEETLYRLLRALASFDVFVEDGEGRFANTDLSTLLRADIPNSMRPMLMFLGEETMLRTWESLQHSVTTGEPGFEHVYGTHHFDYLSRHPDEAKVFDAAMVSYSAMVNSAIAKAYDFSAFGSIVDIAGGYGSTLCVILKAYPVLRGTLFDMPHVVEGARRYIAQQGVADRCEIVAGDFFQSLPQGADAYFMKHIIHDWDDERCVKILRSCHAAMPAHGKLLISERVVPPGNGMSYSKLADLLMLLMTPGGKERTEAQFRQLFEGGGFRLVRLVPTESEHILLECVKN